MCKIILKTLVIAFSLLSIYSCNFGPKPDKVIKMTIAFDESKKSNDEVNSVIKTLKKRISKVSRVFNVEKLPNNNQISINIETHYDSERIKNLVIHQGKLDFYETYKMEELTSFMTELNDVLKKEKEDEDPLFSLITSQGYKGGAILFNVLEKDTSMMNTYLLHKSIKVKLPTEKRYVKFAWGRKEKDLDYFPLYALKLNENEKSALEGRVVKKALSEFNQMAQPTITIEMNDEGATIWEDLTGKAFRERFQIAIVINDEVYSAPMVAQGPITGGRSQISGDFTIEEAKDFANILSSGSIPEMHIVDIVTEKLQ